MWKITNDVKYYRYKK